MKISDLQAANRAAVSEPRVERRDSGGAKQSFVSQLKGLGSDTAMQKLSAMGESITKQGDIVARRCDMLELKKYREMVMEYMNEAVRLMYEFKKQSTLDARGRHRMYAVIKKINSKLDELTKELLTGQADNLSVMNSIDEIRGMLIDLVL